MRGRDWDKHVKAAGLIAVCCGCLMVTAFLWIGFSPQQPELPNYHHSQSPIANHTPGGSGCRPEAIAALAREQVIAERIRCAEAAEEYRLKTSDLIQQTRAADAAEANVTLSYIAAQLTLLGLIIGFLTMVAAGAAVYYSRRAYIQASRSFEMTARPFLYLDRIIFSIGDNIDDTRTCEAHFVVKNSGNTPATNIRVYNSQMMIGKGSSITDSPFEDEDALRLDKIPPNCEKTFFIAFDITNEIYTLLAIGENTLHLAMKVVFDSRFRKDKAIIENRFTDGPDFLNGNFFSNREIIKTPLLESRNGSDGA